MFEPRLPGQRRLSPSPYCAKSPQSRPGAAQALDLARVFEPTW